MRDWALHHLHFVIFLDVILHVIILLAVAAAVHYVFKFIRLIKTHPNTSRHVVFISYLMLIPVAVMGYGAIAALYFCACHYATWWSK